MPPATTYEWGLESEHQECGNQQGQFESKKFNLAISLTVGDRKAPCFFFLFFDKNCIGHIGIV